MAFATHSTRAPRSTRASRLLESSAASSSLSAARLALPSIQVGAPEGDSFVALMRLVDAGRWACEQREISAALRASCVKFQGFLDEAPTLFPAFDAWCEGSGRCKGENRSALALAPLRLDAIDAAAPRARDAIPVVPKPPVKPRLSGRGMLLLLALVSPWCLATAMLLGCRCCCIGKPKRRKVKIDEEEI